MTYGLREPGRIPDAEHMRGSWRIREVVPDFRLEDVWALPAHGGAGDFERLLELAASLDPSRADSPASRLLWQLRDRLGKWFDLGRISGPAAESGGKDELTIPGTEETSLRQRLPDDLRATDTELDLGRLPFQPLYRTADEAAAELANRTVHGVVHFAWAPRGENLYQGEMAVYVKPRGRFGEGYMALIKPFRHLIVYPALMRQFGRAWEAARPLTDRPG